MSHSHADDNKNGVSNYPSSGATTQLTYARNAKYSSNDGVSSSLYGVKKYRILTGLYYSGTTFYASTNDGVTVKTALAPGDIITIPNHHTLIFTKQLSSTDFKYHALEASTNDHAPSWANMKYWVDTYKSSIVAIRVR